VSRIRLPWVIGLFTAAAVYALSPLTIWFAVAIVPAVLLMTRGIDEDERKVIIGIVAVAIAVRLAAIAVLFLTTNHAQVAFGSLFGDEEYFIKRSLWLKNIALGVPVHPFDLEYAFEPNASSSFLYVMAAIQALTGPAPYGLHLLGVFCYVTAALLLYRVVRPGLGRVPAIVGLLLLLFMPSLFAWSIAVLKEPPSMLISALVLALSVALVRDPSPLHRLVAVAGIGLLAAAQNSIRPHGAAFTLLGVGGGLITAFVVHRPRWLLASAIIAPIALGLALRDPRVQLRAYVAVTSAARQHWGAVVVSRGVGYKLLDDRFYSDLNEASSMNFGEAMRFVARGAAAFVTIPRPWDSQTGLSAAYIPEQVLWYVVAVLVPVGIIVGFQRDAVVTGLLLMHAVQIAMTAALTDGNVGTLVRHRGLTLPYLSWISALGLCAVLARVQRGGESHEARSM
jgi:Dolichyl-phosphate-mannose-protein mannosyltransferase